MLLRTENLVKVYGNNRAVDGASLEVEKGQLVGLLGPNGAGKSTTISIISTLIQPTSGDVLYNGQSILKQPKLIQKKLGLVPQNIALYTDLSGFDNLKYWGMVYGLGGATLKKKIESISEIIGISDRLKEPVKNYSGGMQRRINIGAALLHQPEILIMDEPTVGIDPQSRNHILDTVKRLNSEGMAVIYTSHYMEEVEFLCNQVYIMDEGKVIAQGTKEQLVKMAQEEKTILVSFERLDATLVKQIQFLPYVDQIKTEGNKLEIGIGHDGTAVKDIIEIANNNGFAIEAIEVRKPNLESVFLKLTGKALRD